MTGATVHLDTEHDDTKDLAFTLLRALGARFPDVQLGCVVQAYRRDAHADLTDLVAWSRAELRTPLRIRLVKGAYWDAETLASQAEGWPSPVFAEKPETDASFERCVRTMVDAAGAIRPAFATPQRAQPRLRDRRRARRRVSTTTAIELQLLYGMAEPVHAALVRDRARASASYAPVGELVPGMAYLVRRLLENTSNESFVRRRFAEGARPRRARAAACGRRRGAPAPDRADTLRSRPPTDRVRTRPRSRTSRVAELRRPAPRARLLAAVQRAAHRFPLRRAGPHRRRRRARTAASSRRSTRATRRRSCAPARCATADDVDAAIDARAARARRLAGDAVAGARRGAVPRRGDHAPRPRRAGRARSCSRPASPSPRPTPTCARPSTSASTTDGAALRSPRGGPVHSGARRGERVPLPAPRRRRGDRAVELPARDPVRHGHARRSSPATPCCSSRPSRRPASALRLVEVLLEAGAAARRAGVPARRRARRSAPHSSRTPTCRSSRSPARRRWASTSCGRRLATGRVNATSSASSPRWAARTRSSSTPTPTSTSPSPAIVHERVRRTPGRSARRRRG